MADKKYTILIVEDIPTDAELIVMELESASIDFNFKRIETKKAYLENLHENRPDIIISDYSLPGFGALEALALKNEIDPNIPFILVTGAQTEEIAVDCIKKGADDYILKSSLTRLPTSVLNAVKKKKAEVTNFQVQKEVKEREERYRNLFQHSIVGMFRASSKGCLFLEANERAQEILGINTIEGIHFDDFLFCNREESLTSHFTSETRILENYEVQVSRTDGSKVWISISAKLFEQEGIIEGVIHDITNNKNSFIEMERANYELDRFSYHASHDLRSPLRSLEGLIQAALEEDSIEEVKTCLKLMQRSTTKMDGLINDLLLIAQNKKSAARTVSIDFAQELQEAILQLSFMENFKAIEISSNVKQNSPFYSDAVRLRIIFNNIISNAIKYHRINQERPYIHIEVSLENNWAFIRIEDNGTGIQEKHLSKIFDMFYRATNESEGSGLGLYLVKNTVEKIGGTISVASEAGSGTVFEIELPNQQVTSQTPAVAEQEPK